MPGRIMLEAASAPIAKNVTVFCGTGAESSTNANAAMTENPTTAPIHIVALAGRHSRTSSGTPPRVSPMKSEYMIQRCSATSVTATFAPATSATANAAPKMAKKVKRRRLQRNVVSRATAPMKWSYKPSARIIVPPLTPGTTFASPIRTPPSATRTGGTGSRSGDSVRDMRGDG